MKALRWQIMKMRCGYGSIIVNMPSDWWPRVTNSAESRAASTIVAPKTSSAPVPGGVGMDRRDVVLRDHPVIKQGKLMGLQPDHQPAWFRIALTRLAPGRKPHHGSERRWPAAARSEATRGVTSCGRLSTLRGSVARPIPSGADARKNGG